MKVFIDTSYLVAILDSKDNRHKQALRALQELGNVHQVTSEMVLTELLNYFCARGSILRYTALNTLVKLRSNSKVEIIPQSTELFEQACQYYRQRPDKQYSLTDCASMVIMKDKGIDRVLTHDHHFQQEGFIALLRDK